MIGRKYYIIFFLVWYSLILVLSVIPDNSPDTIEIISYEWRLDYPKHLIVFLPLGFSLLRIKPESNILFIFIGLIVGALPELIQYFIPYRAFNPLDVVSNILGLLAGVGLYLILRRKVRI